MTTDVSTQSAERLTSYVYELVLAGQREMLRNLLAEDFVLAGTRERVSRDAWIDLMTLRTQWEAIDVSNVHAVAEYDDLVVAVAQVRYRGTRDGDALIGTWHVIDAWQRHGVDWHLLSRTTFRSS